jgi:hypothetical protein
VALAHLAELAQHTHHLLADPLAASSKPVIKNPAPVAPPGMEKPTETILAYIKWIVGAIVIAAVFIGAGAIAGGKFLHNHGASRVGVGILLSAVTGVVLLGGGYALISQFFG